jgi:hypothetical protein
MSSSAVSAQLSDLQIATGTGGAKTISGVTVGNPTIIIATAHGFGNGDVATLAALTGADAATLNTKSYVVRNKTTNTFAVDQDTTGLTITAGSGTATPVTYTSIKNVHAFGGFNGAATEINVTNFASVAKEFRMGLQDFGNVTFDTHFDGTDAGQLAFIAAQAAAAQKNYKLILSNAQVLSFAGYAKSFSMTGAIDDIYKRAGDIRINGAVTLA